MTGFLATYGQPASATCASAGRIFVIRCQPDPFTDERINVGVCAQDAGGKRHVRCIESAGRLACLYDASATAVVRLAKIAAAAAAEHLPPPSAQITFSKPLPYYNATVEEALTAAFENQVTVARPQRTHGSHEQINDEAAIALVTGELRRTAPLLQGYLPASPVGLVETPLGRRPVTIHLQPRRGVGVIRSGDYSAPALKTHIMESVLDLQCAATYRDRKNQALFLLRPPREPEKLAQLRDEVIDSVRYRTPGLLMEQADRGEVLAQRIAAWIRITD